uniref:Uncharacterized protein n=1 Tax=Fagus sylvatica TaxID=28930 RepID=A0A2N9J433_FAGSY
MEIFSASLIIGSHSVYLTPPVIPGGFRSSRATRPRWWLSIPSQLFHSGSRSPLGLVDLGSRWFSLNPLAPPALHQQVLGCSRFLFSLAVTPLLSGHDTLIVWTTFYLFMPF